MKHIQPKRTLKLRQRTLIERLSKFITWLVVVGLVIIGDLIGISGTITAVISTTFWFICPDIIAYILEAIYEVEHKTDSYR